MKRAAVYSALLCAGIAGCASLRPDRGPGPEEQLQHGLAALDVQDYTAARRLLEPVFLEHWQVPVGQRALLALAASELDGRNPNRRLAAAADLAGRYLAISTVPQWTLPLAETLYLTAQELGAQEEEESAGSAGQPVAGARPASDTAARALPTSPRESVTSRVRRLTSERDDLRQRLQAAEQRLAAREKELRDAQQELERIRKTIKR